MPRDRADRVLDEFSAVTNAAPRPDSPAHRVAARQSFPVGTLSGASLIVVGIAVAALVFGRSGPSPSVGSSPSAPAATSEASTPVASAATASGPAACDTDVLTARITLWEGAAGSRIAHVELVNPGPASCLLEDRSRPVLLDGHHVTLINGTESATSHGLILAPGVVHATLVETGNYCGPDPAAPVTLGFVFADDREVVAAPASATDVTVPPCLGAGQPATIDMHPWAR